MRTQLMASSARHQITGAVRQSQPAQEHRAEGDHAPQQPAPEMIDHGRLVLLAKGNALIRVMPEDALLLLKYGWHRVCRP